MAKVLVVDDQPSTIAIVRYHLESGGFAGVFAGDVHEGWRLLVSESPDAAVVDIRLPGPDGWTLIERLRADGRFRSLPVIVLTGLVEDEVVERARQLGCIYLSKPFAASALLEKLRTTLRDRGMHPPVARPAANLPGPKVTLVEVGVVVLLDAYRIEGKVHLPPELGRFSDAWESVMRDQRTFIPLTDARVTAAGSGVEVSAPPFIEIRKSDVRAVYPGDYATD